MTPPLIAAVRAALRRHANAEKAPQMQAYMKSDMPYRGVATPVQRQLWREIVPAHPLASAGDWTATILQLWREARHREERYAAIALAEHKAYAAYLTTGAMPMLEEMIVTGAWWDYVDTIASHHVGRILRDEPRRMKPRLRRWARDPHLWKRRTAILCQLHFKRDTDLALLYDCIAPNLSHKDFFIRKAIGWALRQHAWTDPDEVRRFVTAHRDALSPLSIREAMKNIGPPSR